ncbi:hypothetical protein AWM75_05040 [Aerococcus urinaehominis]|uniref:Uncharacterized protein n=1 Tax=Aerococcus urinaehominis TaxID=128944 RepID=A0A109RGW9_9LACT|nr:GNAT family N-acetyltransferase [Aerococcus urinaehominis]AMB99396.1 hypothetical protein AWM75_05040 [Aerococcus urinaehominis]SDM23760.1 Acetyltransferase (GNAT) family protein [Aerococcus urinaehominis]
MLNIKLINPDQTGLAHQVFSQAYQGNYQLSPSDLNRLLADDNQAIFGLWHGEELLALAHFQLVLDQADLIDLAVRPDRQGQGYGYYLLSRCLQILSLSQVYLEVRDSNQVAISLYEKLGFVYLSCRKNYYSQPSQDAWVYIWKEDADD